ncbi:MipA/OmpV family protein [Pseudomonadota bacterium]|uniref:MipA/OmpV family protein n=1 Tax=Shewanella sp. 10N.286.48.A6 TaxID=1880833 RepID=UPI000C83C7E4|nr:MipA/OmpV family protein [Shewanella sp. 10N.286.48.A6]PMI03313.1 MltA-interacting MipA family protein [Shewanella sp. 10N.286.48.A6]
MPKTSSLLTAFVCLSTCSFSVIADNDQTKTVNPPSKADTHTAPEVEYFPSTWGVGIGVRKADIPYATENDDVYDVMPLIEFENDYFYLNGLEGGVHLWKNDEHQVNIYSRFRFVDIPKEYQNQTQSDAFDFGFQYRFQKDGLEADVAIMSDGNKRMYGYTRTQYHWQGGDWQLNPYAQFQWKSNDFNEHYYGLELADPGAGLAFSAGVNARYHLASNLYLLGNFGVTRLEDDIYHLPTIENQYQFDSFLGFGFFPDNKRPNTNPVPKESGEFLRVAHGWATPSNLNDILTGNAKGDRYNNQMTSLFYGIPLSNSLFNLPIDLYLTTGAVWHHDSEVQDNLAEGVLAVKAFYTIDLGWRFRIGVAEGLSYVSDVTYIEGSELDEKDYRPSKLLNYLDFSFDVNLGDVFNHAPMKNAWLGYSIHHRSGIFETSSAFGRIKGGSNYNSVYLQWHF